MLCFSSKFFNFIKAAEKAIVGTVGILIQFPLYFGIMGVVSDTGIINDLATVFSKYFLTILLTHCLHFLVQE